MLSNIITAGDSSLKVIMTVIFFRYFSFKIKSRKRFGPNFFTICEPARIKKNAVFNGVKQHVQTGLNSDFFNTFQRDRF